MSGITADQLAKVTSFPKLVSLLRDNLDWPIDKDYELADVIYEYDPAELGLKPDEIAKIREISQLRPLVTNQPWGIFFISFEEKTISVSVLRRMLRNLVFNKRGSAKSSDKQAWAKNDLIFAANFGKSGERELAFVHFSDEGATNDLPVLKVLGWNAKDTDLHNGYVSTMLDEKLRWPDDPKNVARWRKQWSGAFEVKHNEAINTSKDLAIRLAALATNIRARANQLLKAESDKGPMQKMLAAFRKNLIQDLDEDGFADMFAQTISYGLLAAHISRPSGGIVADNLVDMVPKTNPFLRELFSTFLSLGGRDQRKGMDYDELGVRDVVDMLAAANMEAVLRDFGDRNPKEDPVIHFYELFLKEYDPKKRMQRGVFYTPRPIVNFIVRGVDEILRTEFGLPLGLADTTTWGQLAAKNDKITIPPHIKPETPFVQILDPATGTGTFLVEVIDLIHKTMETHWKAEGRSEKAIKDAWNDYVPQQLLPRLTGFELMMAPYAIAHMKIGLKLVETGYEFGSEERAHVYLTNALEPARDLKMEFDFVAEALAHEAKASNSAKFKTKFTIVIGNPPYTVMSANLSRDARSLIDPYRFVDGNRLQEKSMLRLEMHLQDDYIKFFRIGQALIDTSDYGVFGYVSNHSYLDNPTLRGMRQSLQGTFSNMWLCDLHGNSKKKDDAPKDIENQNIFDIQQGVAITLGVRLAPSHSGNGIKHTELFGSRELKYQKLSTATIAKIDWTTLQPSSPFHLFVPQDTTLSSEFEQLVGLLDIMPLNSCGIVSGREALTYDFDKSALEDRIAIFCDPQYSDDQIRKKFNIRDAGGYELAKRRRAILGKDSSLFTSPIDIRPFDTRWVSFTRGVLTSDQSNVMAHMLRSSNVGLIITRQTKEAWGVFVTEQPIAHKAISAYDVSSLFPLFLHPQSETLSLSISAKPNLSTSFLTEFKTKLGIFYKNKIGSSTEITAVDIIRYVYAIFHSLEYRRRYFEFLKTNFPRVPLIHNLKLFRVLARYGENLIANHLLKLDEAPILKNPDIRFAGSGEARVGKGFPEYQNGKVMINATRWFEDVPSETWAFHVGGYQVCEKWLKDRAAKGGKNPSPGRLLTDEDILHYRRIITSLTETRRLMAEIDKVIETHGGWPGAFGGANGKA